MAPVGGIYFSRKIAKNSLQPFLDAIRENHEIVLDCACCLNGRFRESNVVERNVYLTLIDCRDVARLEHVRVDSECSRDDES